MSTTIVSTYKKQLTQEIRNTPKEYLPNLLQLVRVFRESVVLKPADESFRQAWKEMLVGDTHPISELWDGIDAK
jgi:hypothetical protein